jgi:hypothetical protein
MEPVFPCSLVVEDREGLRHATNPVNGRLELLTELAAEARAFGLIARAHHLSFRLGVGMDRERLHG